MSRQQFEEISNLLLAYSAGEYHVKGVISENVDELDMIISGINMLGEELQTTNVSRDFFSGIFNSVSDFVFIVDENGNLTEANLMVTDLLNGGNPVAGKPITDFLHKDNQLLFSGIRSRLDEGEKNVISETVLKGVHQPKIHGLCTSAKLFDRFGKFNGYLITIKDITEQKEKENLILRTVISTQQVEQKRVADDLHDSLGQELSMAQLMISNLSKYKIDDPNYYKLVSTCTEILQGSVRHLREICFDLMPTALIKGGLHRGITELVSRLRSQDKITVEIAIDEYIPRLNPDLEIAAYRIVQEFLNNMIKHANASVVIIHLTAPGADFISLYLKDNGVGFDLAKLENLGENRGVQNIFSKIKAYQGEYTYYSAPGKGTELNMSFPIK